MYAQLSLATLTAIALAFPVNHAPRFTIGATGAMTMNVTGDEARYGRVPAEAAGHPGITISLGATRAAGALRLSVPGDRMPESGRYPIGTFEAYFVAGSPERPLGWFLGESGWVTIVKSEAGRVSGEFEIRARGFTTGDPDNENQWVTLRGEFEAQGDSTMMTVASRE
jgi:hypothetical protein